jgi:uncharacterized membrane protein
MSDGSKPSPGPVNHTMVKVVNEGMAPILQAGVRSAIAFPVVLAFALIARRRLSLSDGTFWPGLFCGLLFAAEFLALFLALDRTTVGRVAVLFYTMPFWVALAAHFLIPGERLTPRRVVGLVLALGGVALALGSAEEGGGSLAGDLLSLFAAACWAGIALTARLTRLSTASVEMQLLYPPASPAPRSPRTSRSRSPAARSPCASTAARRPLRADRADAAVAIVTAKDEADGAGTDPPRRRPCHGPGGAGALARHPVTIGPVIENGWYYDFDRAEPFTPEDLAPSRRGCARSSPRATPCDGRSGTATAAIAPLRGDVRALQGRAVEAIPEGEPIRMYWHGHWQDLCRGPHLRPPGRCRPTPSS